MALRFIDGFDHYTTTAAFAYKYNAYTASAVPSAGRRSGSNAARFANYVAAVLLGARQSGRTAERYDQLKKITEIKDAQLRAAMDAPRTRADLVKRLRDGKL